MGSNKTTVSGGACIFMAFLLLILPLQWILAAMLAALFHEFCHYCAICLCSRQRSSVHLFAFGARMPLPPMSRGKELVCALAGPLGSLLLLFAAKWLPRTAICVALQSAYNLLPIQPMDGGRALSCILHMLLPPPKAAWGCRTVEKICLAALVFLGCYGFFFLQLGPGLLLLAGLLLLRLKFAKIPCKVTV